MKISKTQGALQRVLTLQRAVAGLFSPPCCLVCRRRLVGGEHVLCLKCESDLPRLQDLASPYDNPTARRLWGKVEAERVAAGYEYASHSVMSLLIYLLKYDSRPEIGEWLGGALAAQADACGFFEGIDAIVPLPLHSTRQKERGYNQSDMFARGVARATGIPLDEGIIARTRNTVSQTLLAPSQRAANMDGAFSVLAPERAEGKHLLLVDDILTTGASVGSCIRELQKTRVGKVSVLTIARTQI